MAHPRRVGLWAFVMDNSLLLVAGTLAALVWSNTSLESYERFSHAIHFAVNDVGMVFFFALAAKEIVEATLPGGPLASFRQAAVPLLAAVGGMIVPASLYAAASRRRRPSRADPRVGHSVRDRHRVLVHGGAGHLPEGHAAIPFLLLLAIADDALGLMLLARVLSERAAVAAAVRAVMAPAIAISLWLKRRKVENFWAYVILGGGLSWAALHLGGVHPALALVPILPFMPHAARDRGLFEPSRGGAAGHHEPLRALVEDAGAVHPVLLRAGQRRRAVAGVGQGPGSSCPRSCWASRSASC